MRRLIFLTVVFLLILFGISGGKKYLPQVDTYLQKHIILAPPSQSGGTIKVISEESVAIDVVKKVKPSVVTIAEESQVTSTQMFDPFSFGSADMAPQGPQNIGSGFIIDNSGLIVTNKHVVSDVGAIYKVVTSDDKRYDVKKIYRDPLNDLAIVKIEPSQNPGTNLPPVTLGDSSKLEVGQIAIAIGTPLGDFPSTVTKGIVSGLGRGITAGSSYQGFVERLDNVIQTDAAINPGNSGGPLVNSGAQVIGINTAIAQGGQNIGFALPANLIKESLKNFNETGQFNRPYLGVAYKIISRDLAVLNNLAEGAYVQRVVSDSPADKAGILRGDIITKIDNDRITDQTELAPLIAKKKVGDNVTITYWRDGKTTDVKVTLDVAPNQ